LVEHATPSQSMQSLGLTGPQIADRLLTQLGRKPEMAAV
jgi:hypothetical protein